MRACRSTAIGAVALTVVLLCGSGFTGRASADSAGTVHFVRSADSAFDQFTSSPSPQAQAWLRAHVWRMIVWSPYFDSRTSWYQNGWAYDDAYAIYAGEELASQHPEWILRDAHGNKLYIPWGCSSGSCPQYAADISNPAFRRYWIENLKAKAANGYRGVFIDDVNMNREVGNGQEELIAPIDPSTGQPLTEGAWRHYMAQFMGEVRAALPNAEIVHNVIWFADEHAGTASPDIRSELNSANVINLERGVNDSGLTGGTGAWSVNALLSYIDQIHALGRNVVLDGGASDAGGLEYNLAAYFLISNGGDAVSGAGQTPNSWWTGWGANLGEAAGPRYAWSSLLRRDFSDGMVLVNPPGAPTRTVSLPRPMIDPSGASVRSVTLPPAAGAVLRGSTVLAPLAGELPAAVATKTIVNTTAIRSHRRQGSRGKVRGGDRKHSSAAGGRSRRARSGDPGGRHPRKRARQASRGRPRQAPHRAVLTMISGTVLRATRGTVAIQIDRRARSRWIAIRHLRVAVNPSGRFMQLVHLHAALRYRVRATYSGAAGYRPSRSGYRFIFLGAR